ncbi:putative RNA-directed DNA polymerase from transposon X-element [Lucilia cuprina]|nr:putative RNA-directed DNA polymerase from transposon X-element [Lucilia cuprina]
MTEPTDQGEEELLSLSINILTTKIFLPMKIITAYSAHYNHNFKHDILKLTSPSKDYILLGDLNAKHTSWNCIRNNTAGNVLSQLQHTCNFFVYYPNDPTYYPHQHGRAPSTIDLVLSNTTLNLNLEVLEYEIPSDHRPIVCSISLTTVNTVDLSYYNYKLTNWNSFQNYIDNKIVSNTNIYNTKTIIDNELSTLSKIILEARDISTPKLYPSDKVTLPDKVIKYIKVRRTFNRKFHRSTNLFEANFYKQYSRFLSKLIDENINTERNRKWSALLSQLKPGDKSFWRISRNLRAKGQTKIPHLNVGITKIISDSGKAEVLANRFVQANNLTAHFSHSFDKKVDSLVDNFRNQYTVFDDCRYTSLCEMINLISSLKSSKSPGFDNISNLLLKKLPLNAIKLLVTIFNGCIKLNYFPSIFKTAKIIPIHKPNKPKNDPGSYRPISLLSNLGKLLEKIVHSRLNQFIEENSILSKSQFGFRKEHSTTHQINRIKNKIINNITTKRSTGMILLDIEKAFDTVWHKGLLYKLLEANVPKYLCGLIDSFLDSRNFCVALNGVNSAPKGITNGLPQGSVLSPILYSIYTSDFTAPKDLETAYYADDTALISSSKLTSALLRKMEKGLSACTKYFHKWRIKINPNKTQAIIFPYNKSPKRIPRRQISIGNEHIPIDNCVKYLGVILDKKLIFREHIEQACQKAIKAIRSLWPLLNKHSYLNAKNKNLLYKSIIRPILTYASPVWYTAANYHLKRLQIIQNKCLKIINNKNWKYPTNILHQETKYEKIFDFITRLNNKYFEKVENSSYPLIRECRPLI